MSYERQTEAIWESAPEVMLNDLPRYSRWPARMLGLERWTRDERTPEDIEREFERETYLPQYEFLLRHPDVVEHHSLYSHVYPDSREFVCVKNNQFRKLSIADAFRLEAQLIARRLEPELPASSLVELGSGNGRILLGLTDICSWVKDIPLIALEKMESGQKITRILAERKGVTITTSACNVAETIVTKQYIPENSILYTNHLLYIVNTPTEQIVEAIKRVKPKIVFHFEPCYSFLDENTLHGQLCLSYMNINKYNKTFAQEMLSLDGKSIDIVKKERNIFGNNPYLPASLIAWKPK